MYCNRQRIKRHFKSYLLSGIHVADTSQIHASISLRNNRMPSWRLAGCTIKENKSENCHERERENEREREREITLAKVHFIGCDISVVPL